MLICFNHTVYTLQNMYINNKSFNTNINKMVSMTILIPFIIAFCIHNATQINTLPLYNCSIYSSRLQVQKTYKGRAVTLLSCEILLHHITVEIDAQFIVCLIQLTIHQTYFEKSVSMSIDITLTKTYSVKKLCEFGYVVPPTTSCSLQHHL